MTDYSPIFALAGFLILTRLLEMSHTRGNTLLQEYRNGHERILFVIERAGIDPRGIILRARFKNFLQEFGHAWHNRFQVQRNGLVEITQPGSLYREYAPDLRLMTAEEQAAYVLRQFREGLNVQKNARPQA